MLSVDSGVRSNRGIYQHNDFILELSFGSF